MRARSRRTARIGAALAVASGALVACNLLTGLDADYSSSAHDGATAPVGEGGGPDAPGQDGQIADGATDAMVKVDGDAGSSWCKSKQGSIPDEDFFCTDFEGATFPEGGIAPAGWSSMSNTLDAGALGFLDVDGSTALDIVGASNGSAGAQTRLLRTVSTTDSHQFLHYDLEYDFCVLGGNLQYAAVGLLMFSTISSGTKEHGIALYGPGPGLLLSQEGGNGALDKKFANDGLWHHATVTLDRAAADTTYTRTILIDGSSVNGDAAPPSVDTADPANISIGVFNGAPAAGTAHVQFDNIVFHRKR